MVTLQPGENSAPSFTVSGVALDEISLRVIVDQQTSTATEQGPSETQPLPQSPQEQEELRRAKRTRLQDQEDLRRAEKVRQLEQENLAAAAELSQKQEQEQKKLAAVAELKRKQEQDKLAAAAELKQKQEQEQKKLAAAAELKRKQEQEKLAAAAELKRKQEEEQKKLAAAAELKRKQEQEIQALVAEMKRNQSQKKLSLAGAAKKREEEESSTAAPVKGVHEQKEPAHGAELMRQQAETRPAPRELQPEEPVLSQALPPLLGQPRQGISQTASSSPEGNRGPFSGKKEYSFIKPATDCITTFINAEMNGWLAYQNNCSSAVHLFYSNPGFGSLDIGPGEVETSGWECDESCTPSFGACPEGYSVLSTTMDIYTPQMQRERKPFMCGKAK
jgi:hypothetical protein